MTKASTLVGVIYNLCDYTYSSFRVWLRFRRTSSDLWELVRFRAGMVLCDFRTFCVIWCDLKCAWLILLWFFLSCFVTFCAMFCDHLRLAWSKSISFRFRNFFSERGWSCDFCVLLFDFVWFYWDFERICVPCVILSWFCWEILCDFYRCCVILCDFVWFCALLCGFWATLFGFAGIFCDNLYDFERYFAILCISCDFKWFMCFCVISSWFCCALVWFRLISLNFVWCRLYFVEFCWILSDFIRFFFFCAICYFWVISFGVVVLFCDASEFVRYFVTSCDFVSFRVISCDFIWVCLLFWVSVIWLWFCCDFVGILLRFCVILCYFGVILCVCFFVCCAIRFSFGRRLVNLLPVAQRTNVLTNDNADRTCVTNPSGSAPLPSSAGKESSLDWCPLWRLSCAKFWQASCHSTDIGLARMGRRSRRLPPLPRVRRGVHRCFGAELKQEQPDGSVRPIALC